MYKQLNNIGILINSIYSIYPLHLIYSIYFSLPSSCQFSFVYPLPALLVFFLQNLTHRFSVHFTFYP